MALKLREASAALSRLREKLDAGLCDELLKKYRNLATTSKSDWDEYQLIILAALIMTTGAKIKDDDMQHLRQLASVANSNEGFTMPLFDSAFRDPG
jgi:preprotein translocase subunit Sss1